MNSTSAESALKDYLLDHDFNFRSLATKHNQCESRLHELSSIPHPSEEEQLEEHEIKKKKLYLKDQMEQIMTTYKTSGMSH